MREFTSVEPFAQVFWLYVEGCADIVKREEPQLVLMVDPLLGLSEALLSSAGRRIQIALIVLDGLFKESEGEELLPLEELLSLQGSVPLFGQKNIGLKRCRQRLFFRGPLSGQGARSERPR